MRVFVIIKFSDIINVNWVGFMYVDCFIRFCVVGRFLVKCLYDEDLLFLYFCIGYFVKWLVIYFLFNLFVVYIL